MISRTMKKLSVYIHIPFCIKKCNYCDFLSFPAEEEVKENYVQALMGEIDFQADQYRDYLVDTVFLGGGTPSLLTGNQMKRIMERLERQFTFGDNPEITMEMNPGTASCGSLGEYKEAGINRLSIGTQSVCDRELALLGRIHKAEDFFRTYREARRMGFENINVDIMSALPGQTVEEYQKTLQAVAALEPEHISAYSLMIEEGTPFYDWYETDKRDTMPKLPTEDEERTMYECTENFLVQQGYHRYEISNYAKEGKECRHNTAYWRRYDYVGFGIGAASMVDNTRWKNTSDIDTYFSRATAGKNIREELCKLSLKEQMEEFMFLGLRLTKGISGEEFYKVFGRKLENIYGDIIENLCKKGLLVKDEQDNSVRLTSYGRDISNYVLAEFLLDEES